MGHVSTDTKKVKKAPVTDLIGGEGGVRDFW